MISTAVYMIKMPLFTTKAMLFFLLFIFGYSSISFTQNEEDALIDRELEDTLLRIEFESYLTAILSKPNDTLITIDSTKKYHIRYKTVCAFDHFIDQRQFLDSMNYICLVGLRKMDHLGQIDFIDSIPRETGQFELEDGLTVQYFTYRRISQIHFFSAEYATFMSFNQGKYVILREIHFMPDNRGSMPPGYVTTYFMELVDNE